MTKIDDAIEECDLMISSLNKKHWVKKSEIAPAIKKAIADYLNMMKRTAAITPREEDLIIAIKKELCGEDFK